MSDARYYLAYGSNMVEDQMDKRAPEAEIVSKEMLLGWELEFKDTPCGVYLNLIENPASQTPVFIWKITDLDERNMDEYEDWPRSYIKKEISWSKGKAMMYVVPNTITKTALPKDEYINPILDTYRQEGYDTSHILNLLKRG